MCPIVLSETCNSFLSVYLDILSLTNCGSNTVAGTQYAFAPIPMMSAFDKGSGLPVLGWLAPLNANASDNVGNPSDSEGE